MNSDRDKNNLTNSSDYKDWLVSLKTKIRQAQLKAVVAVNRELLLFYWDCPQILLRNRTILVGEMVF